VVLFNHDDPTGKRDWRRFSTLRSAIPDYDLCAVVRFANVSEFAALGARAVVRAFMTYDEVAHAPGTQGYAVASEYRSDVCFIGANYKGEGRDIFLSKLIERGVDLAIWGDHWERSTVWSILKAHTRGGNLFGSAYVDAIRGSKVCLGLLSKRNRDEHTTRSMEIPYAGGVLCAQRTAEHINLYQEGKEAVFWSSVDECYDACVSLLADDDKREAIRHEGMRRVRENKTGNESLIGKVISHPQLFESHRADGVRVHAMGYVS
jgi:hypothetical protein